MSEKTIINADVCVIGSGASGIAAAISAARNNLKTVLVENQQNIGGQAVNALIGTFCGFYSNMPKCEMLTRGIAEEMMHDLEASGGLFERHSDNTRVPIYDCTMLGRWAEKRLLELDVILLTGTILSGVNVHHEKIVSVTCEGRFNEIQIEARYYIDASGDAALAYKAGAPIREINGVRGSIMFSLRGVDYSFTTPSIPELNEVLSKLSVQYGLNRKKGLIFYVPERNDYAICNLTHVDVNNNDLSLSYANVLGKEQADRTLQLLKNVYPGLFGKAYIESYGCVGIRQNRQIQAIHRVTLKEIQESVRFADTIGRCSWPIELHNDEEYYWSEFDGDHIHFIPFSCMTSVSLMNYVAAGRCVDAESEALASIRVMGPCMAMGMAAGEAAVFALDNDVRKINIQKLQEKIRFNIG